MSDFKRIINVTSPNPVDVEVGRQIKLQRQVMGLSQTKLALQIGVTFQQVQKYEKGINRVGASRLVKIAQCLDVPISHFFKCEQIGKQEEDATVTRDESDLRNFLVSSQGIALNRAFVKLPKPIKKLVLSMVKAISGEHEQ